MPAGLPHTTSPRLKTALGKTVETQIKMRQPEPNESPNGAPRPRPVGKADSWEATAVDITKLDKHDAADRRRINNAWRHLKATAPQEAQAIKQLFPELKKYFPNAGIKVPAETMEDGNNG